MCAVHGCRGLVGRGVVCLLWCLGAVLCRAWMTGSSVVFGCSARMTGSSVVFGCCARMTRSSVVWCLGVVLCYARMTVRLWRNGVECLCGHDVLSR